MFFSDGYLRITLYPLYNRHRIERLTMNELNTLLKITWTQRDYQIALIYTVVAAVVVYACLTHWFPQLLAKINSEREKADLIKSLELQLAGDNFEKTMLTNFDVPQVKAAPSAKKKIEPKFTLKAPATSEDTTFPSKHLTQAESKASIPFPKFQLRDSPAFRSDPDAIDDTQQEIPRLQTNSRPLSPFNQESNDTRRSQGNIGSSSSSAAFLGAFAADSIEARLHATLNAQRFQQHDQEQQQAQSDSDMARMIYERELRAQQDEEYNRSIQRDQESSLKQKETEVVLLLLTFQVGNVLTFFLKNNIR